MVIFDFAFVYRLDTAGTYVEHTGGESTLVKTVYSYPTRIYDVRWSARRYKNSIERMGLYADYYEAFYITPEYKDNLTGTLKLSGLLAEQNFSTGREEFETNLEIGYFKPKLIAMLQPTYQPSLSEEERGNIYLEAAEIEVPIYYMFHRWDIIRSQDKNWVVYREPKLLYDYKGYIFGFTLEVRSLRPGIVDF